MSRSGQGTSEKNRKKGPPRRAYCRQPMTFRTRKRKYARLTGRQMRDRGDPGDEIDQNGGGKKRKKE